MPQLEQLSNVKEGARIILYWDSFNGYDDEYDHSPYDYSIYVKFGSPFVNTDETSPTQRSDQQAEASNSFVGIVDDKSAFWVSADQYITKFTDDNGETIELEEYQTYALEYYAQQEGEYYFVIWARKGNGSYYGPTYYPPFTKKDNPDQPGNPNDNDTEQKPIVVDNVNNKKVDPSKQVSIFGLTYEGNPDGLDGSPGSKSLGSNQFSVDIKDDTSPDFTYSVSFDNKEGMQNIYFDSLTRVTIREQNTNPETRNQPSPNIFFEITGSNLVTTAGSNFVSFDSSINSIESAIAVRDKGTKVDNSDASYFISDSGFAITSNVTEDAIPIRNFDIVVEAYNPHSTNTSAGNKVHDGVINDSESNFSEGKYDILEVNLLPPSGLIFANEYSERDNFISPQVGYDKKLPYILEPRITENGEINITFLESVNSNSQKFLTSEEIAETYLKGIRGGVVYYSDEAFTLDPEQIKLKGEGENTAGQQKIEVEKADGTVKTILVKRSFFTIDDVTKVSVNSLSIPFEPFRDQNLKQSNVVIGLFDKLLYDKHFLDDDKTRIQVLDGVSADTILGEKNLSFSKVIVPIKDADGKDQFDTFNASVHLSAQPSSMVFYKKSPVDEGAKALSYRAFIYFSMDASGKVKTIQSNKIGSLQSSIKSLGSANTKESEISISLRETKIYAPVVSYFEEDFINKSNISNTVEMLTETTEAFSTFKIKVSSSAKLKQAKFFIGFMSGDV